MYKILTDDDIIITYDNVILENNLLYKKNISDDVYKKIISDTNYYKIYDKTLKYISKKMRSQKQIKEYLNKTDLTDDEIERIIFRLKEKGFIDDIKYCRAFINDKVYLSKSGINKIRVELLDQDIPIEIIEKELNNVDDEFINERLEKLILNKIKNNHKYSNYYLKQKLLNEFINMGYSKDKIINIIDKNLLDEDNIIKKEFEKIYFKLSKKYSGKDLEVNVKKNMLSKGFEIDKINDLLEKSDI